MKIRKTTFETAPKGTHPARITTIADLGLQRDDWKGEVRTVHRLGITFELTGKKTKEGNPFAIFERATLSLNDRSRLYQIVHAVLGEVPEEIEIQDLLDCPVLVEIVHKETDGKVWANVQNVAGIPEGMDVPKTKTPILWFDLEAPDAEVYHKLPSLFRTLIERRVKGDTAQEPPPAPEPVHPDDDLSW